jgi:biopolymer transport protein ExbD
MLGSRHNRKRPDEEDADIDVVPVMNVFLVIVLLLLISFSFFNLKAINTSVPVLANSDVVAAPGSDIRLTVIVELEEKGIRLSALSDDADAETLKRLGTYFSKENAPNYPLNKLSSYLQTLKTQYPKSDTVIIIPEGSIVYDTIIQTMDVARYSKDTQLFPHVVISGKVS